MLNKLLKKIIDKSFTGLCVTPISINFAHVFFKHDAYCIYFTTNNSYHIGIDHSLKNNRKAIIGAIVHELNHIEWELFSSDNYFKQDFKLYQSELKHKQRDEIYTDIQTILKGYGKELLELMNHYHKHPTLEYTNGSYCGLKSSDIKKLIKG